MDGFNFVSIRLGHALTILATIGRSRDVMAELVVISVLAAVTVTRIRTTDQPGKSPSDDMLSPSQLDKPDLWFKKKIDL